jgi:hypothetical protein
MRCTHIDHGSHGMATPSHCSCPPRHALLRRLQRSSGRDAVWQKDGWQKYGREPRIGCLHGMLIFLPQFSCPLEHHASFLRVGGFDQLLPIS